MKRKSEAFYKLDNRKLNQVKMFWILGSRPPYGLLAPWAGLIILRRERYFPTSLLVTGLTSYSFGCPNDDDEPEFTGQIPFKDVYVTGLIRDENGQKCLNQGASSTL
ncbi:MAG: hypothetical protein CM15mP12_8730 [Gammaproteobacteria bacterium]|nr:MAG: hypothetical protein CM15mP12_8730 [Gammaproteobacteria bacterium]